MGCGTDDSPVKKPGMEKSQPLLQLGEVVSTPRDREAQLHKPGRSYTEGSPQSQKSGSFLGTEMQESLFQAWSGLKASGVVEQVTLSWAAAAVATYGERETLVHVLGGFLFGHCGALNSDGGAVRIVVPDWRKCDKVHPRLVVHEGSTERWQLRAEQTHGGLVRPLFTEVRDQDDVIIDLEGNSDLASGQLGEVCMACTSRCLEAYVTCPMSIDMCLQIEQFLLLLLSLAKQGFGSQVLTAMRQLLPQTAKIIMPLARSELVHDMGWVRLRTAINYKKIEETYSSVVEYERLGHCLITIYDESRANVIGIIELRQDILEIAVKTLDSVTGTDKIAPASELLPAAALLISGNGILNIHVEQIQLSLTELGCASIALPSAWLQVEHHVLAAADTAAATGDPDKHAGHVWSAHLTEVSSMGRVLDALLRPFINMAVYREALCRVTSVEISAQGPEGTVRVRSAYPLPKVSKVLCKFLKWWFSRQLAALDELRLVSNICEAVARDFGAQGLNSLDSFVSAITFYEDCHDGRTWLQWYETEVGDRRRQEKCCLRRCWRWCSWLCCGRRRR